MRLRVITIAYMWNDCIVHYHGQYIETIFHGISILNPLTLREIAMTAASRLHRSLERSWSVTGVTYITECRADRPGACPTNTISIEFEIRSKLGAP